MEQTLKNKINKYEDYYKKYIEKAIMKKKYNCAIKGISYLAKFLHFASIKLYDDYIEKKITELSCLIGDVLAERISHIEYLLYDSICSDSTVLSKHYLKALIDMNVDFIYLVTKRKNKNDCRRIYDIAKKCPKCLIIEIPNNNDLKKIKFIRKILVQYDVSKVIVHSKISDAVAPIAFSKINNIETFFVNHGNNQFWIGSKSYNYYMEINDTSRNLSVYGRKINCENSIYAPIYPFIEKNEFQGIPFEIPNDAVLLFSGGRFAKVYDESMTFCEMVYNLLKKNDKAFFIFAGDGDSSRMKNYITSKKLENRWKVIKYRTDLFELMKKMDVYVSTYPTKGGLMTQYAAYANLPILELNDNSGMKSEDMFLKPELIKITCDSLNEYYDTATKMINDLEYRKRFVSQYKGILINEDMFFKNLQNILLFHKSIFECKVAEIDSEITLSLVRNAGSVSNKTIKPFMVNTIILKNHFFCFLNSFFSKVYFKYIFSKFMKF